MLGWVCWALLVLCASAVHVHVVPASHLHTFLASIVSAVVCIGVAMLVRKPQATHTHPFTPSLLALASAGRANILATGVACVIMILSDQQ